MAAFDPETDLSMDRAFQMLRWSPVTLFWRPQLLDDTTAWLSARDYQVTELDASGWREEADLHRDLAAALSFPGYYGHNLNALEDCMRDVVDQDYGWTPNATGLVLVFTSYDAFAGRCRHEAQDVLDIMAGHSRHAALLGRRLLCLVQSNDPNISFEGVGASGVTWNRAESLKSRRQPGVTWEPRWEPHG